MAKTCGLQPRSDVALGLAPVVRRAPKTIPRADGRRFDLQQIAEPCAAPGLSTLSCEVTRNRRTARPIAAAVPTGAEPSASDRACEASCHLRAKRGGACDAKGSHDRLIIDDTSSMAQSGRRLFVRSATPWQSRQRSLRTSTHTDVARHHQGASLRATAGASGVRPSVTVIEFTDDALRGRRECTPPWQRTSTSAKHSTSEPLSLFALVVGQSRVRRHVGFDRRLAADGGDPRIQWTLHLPTGDHPDVIGFAASMRRRRAGPAPAAVRSRPRTRQTSNAEAAPKSAWGVQAQRRRAKHVAQHRPGPRASIDTRPRWRLTACGGPDAGAGPALRRRSRAGARSSRGVGWSRLQRWRRSVRYGEGAVTPTENGARGIRAPACRGADTL